MISQTYPSGKAVSRSYDATNRNTSIDTLTASGSQNIMSYSYDMLHKNTETLGNGRVTAFTYDAIERLASHR